MIKNFIAEIVHVTKRLKAKDVEVEDRLATSDLNSESINVEKDLTVGNNAVIKKDLTIKGNETVEKNLTVNGTSTLKGNVAAEKDLTVKGNETVEKDLTVKGNETVEKNLTVNGKTTMKELTVEKIVDNGKVYGVTSEINELTWDTTTNKNTEGSIEKPARIDHKHKIPVPKKFTIKNHDGTSSVEYNAQADKELKIDPDFTGSAKKNHKSATTDYGVGNSSEYGHVKLKDEMSNNHGVSQGTAATPKMVYDLAQDIADKYLKKAENAELKGSLKIKNSVYLDGDSSETSDNMLKIYGVGNSSIVRVKLGNGNSSPEIVSPNNGNLYIRHKGSLYRKISDYDIEAFITPDSKLTSNKKEWSPSRTGWYRIYLVGGGGLGASAYTSTATSAPVSTHSDGYGEGVVAGGYGGCGGNVAIIDLLVGDKIGGVSIDNSGNETEASGEENSGEDNTTTEDSVAVITFEKGTYVVSYGGVTGDWGHMGSDGGKTTDYRGVGISGLSNIGTMIEKTTCSRSDYDAYAGHGADAFAQSNSVYTGTMHKICTDHDSTGISASGGRFNYDGQRGDVAVAKIQDVNMQPSSVSPSSYGDSGTTSTHLRYAIGRRADGYHGGAPGSVGITGSVGESGSPGAIKSYKSYYSKDHECYVTMRCGTGGCLSIAELDHYHGSTMDHNPQATTFRYPKKAPTDRGGYGYFGGGNGGSGAVITTNSAYTKSTAQKLTYNRERRQLYPCVVIAYMGNQIT